MKMNTKYSSYDVIFVSGEYFNGRLAIQALDSSTYEPIMVITVNVERVPLSGDEILIKSYSENEGTLEFLEENGLIEKEEEYKSYPTGFVQVQKATITQKMKDLIAEGDALLAIE